MICIPLGPKDLRVYAVSGSTVREQEQVANARLIAAAPRLLIASEAAQLALRSISRKVGDFSEELRLLREAITQVEGGS